jgi:hypothetical protein
MGVTGTIIGGVNKAASTVGGLTAKASGTAVGRMLGMRGGGMGLGAIAFFGMNVAMAGATYKTDRAKGNNAPVAAMKAIGQSILWQDFFLPMVALTAAPMVPLINQQYQNHVGNLQRALTPMSPWGSSELTQSQAAQTSRQRSLQAISNSRLNARSYLGNEAGLFSARYR